MRRRRVAVRVEYEERLPPLTGERVQLQQAVLNLLSNASDADGDVHERHNGKFWAAANDGPGVTFSFSLPLAPRE